MSVHTSFTPTRPAALKVAAMLSGLLLAAAGLVQPAHGIDVDVDGDGHGADDCAPYDPSVSPSAPDLPDPASFTDTNCDGIDGDAAQAVFVAPDGSDSNVGTMNQPFVTLQKAVDVAKTGGKQVYAAVGTYSRTVISGATSDGIQVYGGYEAQPGPWTRTTDFQTTIEGVPEGVLVSQAQDVVLQLVRLRGLTSPVTNLSAYGLRGVQGAEVALVASTVVAAAGLPGTAGSSASTPLPPPTAAAGAGGTCDTPGTGGSGSAPFPHVTGGAGGTGGQETNDGENGSPGGTGFGTSPGSGGSGGIDTNGDSSPAGHGGTGGDGGIGIQGQNGNGGSNGTGSAAALWVGSNGASGTSGGNGGSGGGGGGGAGNGAWFGWAAGGGGGQGGHGGRGGTAGSGGTWGGGSFGVYLHNASVVVDGSTVTAGNGGAGGAGGTGANGGAGGQGGSGGPGGAPPSCGLEAGDGGRGGTGGPGGNGGSGGGGSGGPSVAILRLGTANASVTEDSTLAHGTAGPGGVGPGAAGEGWAGQTGLVVPEGAATTDFDGDGETDAADDCPTTAGGAADANGDGCPEPPDTSLAGGPTADSFALRGSASFGLGSTETGSTFTCSRDDGAGAACTNPHALTGLSQGTHLLRAWATDPAGTADPTAATRTWSVPFNNTTLTHSTGWTKKKASGYYLGTYSQATRKGASLSRNVTDVRKIALVATRGKGFGTVNVLLGSTLLKKVSLAAASLRKKQLIQVASFAGPRDGKVRVVVVSSGRTVRVEGLGLHTPS